MRITSSSTQTFRFRFLQIIGLSGVIAIAACQEVIAPEAKVPDKLRLDQSASSDALGTLSANLDDMTGWSLAALPNEKGKANIIGVLNGLKGHLKSGTLAACQQDVKDARAYLGALTDVQQVEVGHVGVALDLIQATLDNASK